MADTLSLNVVLGAKMGSSLSNTFGQASKSVGKLGKALKATHVELNQVRAFQRTEVALDETRGKLAATQRKVMDLRKAMAADPHNAALARKLEKTRGQAVRLSTALEKQRGKLRQEGEALRKAGVDTNNLNTASERLTQTYNHQRAVLGQTYALMEKRRALRGQIMGQWAKLTGAFLAARPLIDWTKDAAAFDAEMQNIGNTADMTAAQIGSLKRSIFDASKATGRSIGDVQAGIGFLVAAGLDVGRARKSIVAIGRTATAESANIEDLAKASFTLIDSMGIKPKALPQALDILTQAGKEGNVELRDMAQQLPVLGAQFRAFKMQGAGAVATMGAALEIARKGAADPSEAANNMRNFMAKVLSPTTLSKAKANFGLDLYKIIQDAQKSGGNPFEASIQAIMKATGGDAKKLGEMFQDMQVQNFLRPMMANWSEYQRIKAKALNSTGVVDRDFEKVSKTTNQRLAVMGQAWDRLKKNVGTALGSGFVSVFHAITPVLNVLGQAVERYPKFTAAVIAGAGALLTFKTAALSLKLLGTFLPNLGIMGGLVRAMVPGLGLARGGIMGVTVAMRGLGAAALANPIGIVIGAIAVGALLVYKYWQPIKAFFRGVWQGISQAAGPTLSAIGTALAPLKPAWDAVAGAIGAVFRWIGRLFQPFQATQSQLQGATDVGVRFGQSLALAFKIISWPIRTNIKLIGWLGRKIGETIGWVVVNVPVAADAIKTAWNGAMSFVGSLWDGLKVKVEAVVGWIAQKLGWFSQKWQAVKGFVGKLGGVWDNVKGAVGSTAKAMTVGAALAAPAAAGAARMPAPAPASRATTVSHTTHAPITVIAAPGMDEKAVGAEVRKQLDERDRQQAARTRSTLGDLD